MICVDSFVVVILRNDSYASVCRSSLNVCIYAIINRMCKNNAENRLNNNYYDSNNFRHYWKLSARSYVCVCCRVLALLFSFVVFLSPNVYMP